MTEEPVKSPYTFQATLRKALALHLIALCLWIPATQEASAAPQRVISTSPAITEILFALGAGDRVVGVTDFCSYPESACRLPSIGGTLNPSSEAWIGLKPDLIIHQADSEAVHDHAKILGIPTLTVSVRNLKSILTTTQIIADSLHTPKAGQQLVQQLKTGIDHYQSRLDSQTPKQVLLLLGDSNDPARDLYAVGKGTFLDELLTVAGGENVLSANMAKYPKISKEFIISKSPEIIIEVGPMSKLSEVELKKRRNDWGRFSTIRAVQNNHIYFISADHILIPGPRLLSSIDKLTRTIHPNLFSEPSHLEQEKVSP